ncbi:MAG: threonine ammonia-lyase [Thermodesulfobacteriota bacterium]
MVDPATLRRALEVVRTHVPPSPLILSEHFSRVTGAQVYLKLENLQRTGSFKIRGALFKLSRCREAVGPQGVVTASAGNHAQGVALAATWTGVPATVVMPEGASISKQLATRDYGATVILHGRTIAEALERASTMVRQGYTFVHPYDDEDIVAGQGTAGLEILDQVPGFDEVWVPVGGGGLIAGITAAVKDARPGVRVVGVQAEACPSAREARRVGGPVTVVPARSIADGILVPRVGAVTYPVLATAVDEVRTVDEDRIAMTIVELLEKKKVLAEGAGAAALAALLAAPPESIRGHRVVVVVSGGNVDLNTLDRILEQGLIRTGRILRFAVVLDDAPGALGTLLSVVARERANILHIVHDRLSLDLPLGRTRVEVSVETRGEDHIGTLCGALAAAGFPAEPRGRPCAPAGRPPEERP